MLRSSLCVSLMHTKRMGFHACRLSAATASRAFYSLSLHDALPILPMVALGKSNWGVLVRLKNSVRNCTRYLSVKRKSLDRKSTRLNSSHSQNSYDVSCQKQITRVNQHVPVGDSHVAQLIVRVADAHKTHGFSCLSFVSSHRVPRVLLSFPTRRSSDLADGRVGQIELGSVGQVEELGSKLHPIPFSKAKVFRSEEHTSELQSQSKLV